MKVGTTRGILNTLKNTHSGIDYAFVTPSDTVNINFAEGVEIYRAFMLFDTGKVTVMNHQDRIITFEEGELPLKTQISLCVKRIMASNTDATRILVIV
jgi:hypothetical protein